MQTNTFISTADFAALFMVQPNTIRAAHCKDGHYYGIRPIKQPNGLLAWPADARERVAKAAEK